MVVTAMGEIDIAFRRLLRGLPWPILRLAFPRRRLEPVGSPRRCARPRS